MERPVRVTTASRGDEVANILQRIEFGPREECWKWLGTVSARPYFNKVPATHAVWSTFGNDLPDEYHLHHLCGTAWCVNPWHLRPLLAEEHYRNHALSRRRSTHCPNGHEWTPENTAFRKGRGQYIPRRDCRACARERMARARRR